MSATFEKIVALVQSGDIRISEHGYDELVADGLSVRDVVVGMEKGVVVEDYPDFPKGPSVLILQKDRDGRPIHVVWGIPKGHRSPAVIVTAYRPDPDRWDASMMRRRK